MLHETSTSSPKIVKVSKLPSNIFVLYSQTFTMATTQKESDIAPQASHTLPDDHLEHSKSTAEVIHNAKQASDNEHRMTLMQGIKLYPKAVGWSILISTCIVMEGYDVCLLSNFCKYQTPPYKGGH